MILSIDSVRGNSHHMIAPCPFCARFYSPIKFNPFFPNPKTQRRLVRHRDLISPLTLYDIGKEERIGKSIVIVIKCTTSLGNSRTIAR